MKVTTYGYLPWPPGLATAKEEPFSSEEAFEEPENRDMELEEEDEEEVPEDDEDQKEEDLEDKEDS